ncbi:MULTISPECIES: hypothetical protein [Clostridium]|uniref:hypothetical protein n=1 Tax=Clostridium TaxID=1485 RepID=UPI001FA79C7E|nr:MULTISPECIES: hypothetical protein [Clostridium]
MSFSNKGIWGTILFAVIIFIVALLFIKLLPFIIVAGLAIWGISKISKVVENKKKDKIDNFKEDNFAGEHNFDSEQGDVIDVDYTEVKH